MSIVNAKEIMVEAAKEGYAVGAFNITDLLQFEAVIDAAIEKKSPVIVQTSVKPSKFLGTNMMVAIYRTLARPRRYRSACTSITARKLITAKSVQMRATPTS